MTDQVCCLYCGKPIVGAKRRNVQFCVDKSTCRVAYRREEKKAEKRRAELQAESELKAKLQKLSKYAPQTVAKFYEYTSKCEDPGQVVLTPNSALNLCLTAYAETIQRVEDTRAGKPLNMIKQ